MLRKNAAVTAIAVISLAIAIGANTATFSILDAWLLRPLPFKNADRLVTVLRGDPQHPAEPGFFPLYRDFRSWQEQSHSFEQIAGAYWRGFTMTGWGDPQRVGGMVATANLFDVLGVHPLIGRSFSRADLHGPAVAVIGYGFWQEHFGGRRDVLGKTIDLNDKPYQIIGVIPRNMGLRISNQPSDPNIYTLLQPGESGYSAEGEGPMAAVARLKPGVSLAAATAELNTIQQRINSQFRVIIYLTNQARSGILVLWKAHRPFKKQSSTSQIPRTAIAFSRSCAGKTASRGARIVAPITSPILPA